MSEIQKLNRGLEKTSFERRSEPEEIESMYGHLYENNPLPIWICDNESLAIIEVNTAAIQNYGYSRQEFLSMNLKDLGSEEDVHIPPEYFAGKQNGFTRSVPVKSLKKNGETMFVELISREIDFYNGKAKLVMANDVTFIKIAIDEIKGRNEFLEQKVVEISLQLEAAKRAKSEFLTNVSHEIRTPMNAILGYSELLGSVVTDQLQTAYLDSIRTSGRALISLFTYILDLSKIDADKLELNYEYLDAETFFSEFRNVFSQKISEKRLNFKVDISNEIEGCIFTDEARLRQIILNLLGNAIKFTEWGHVSLKIYSENRRIEEPGKEKEVFDLVIEVEDTGIGIPEESQKVIFDSFVQVKDKLSRGGTGLGLALTKSLVKLMKGTITFISEQGKGSTFTVRIPDVSKVINIENPGNLEYSTTTGSDNKPATGSGRDITDLPGLISALDIEFMNKWKNFETRQPLGEVREFGKNLTLLGIEHNSDNVRSYGEDLVAAANSFNIEVILRLIRQYKGLVEDLKSLGMLIVN